MVIRVNRNVFHSYGAVEMCLQCILFANCIQYCLRVWQVKLFDNDAFPNSIYIYGTIFVLFLVGILPQVCNRMKKDILVVFLILVTLYLISYWKNGFETICFDNTFIWTFGSGCVSYIVVRYIDSWDTMLKIYTRLSRIMLIIAIISWFQTRNVINYRATPEWYMFFSSALLMPILGVFILFEKKRKIFDLLLVIIGIVLVFMYGSRGTLVQISIFLFLYYVMNGKYLEGVGRLFLIIVMLFIFFRYVANYVDISSSRTLSLLFNNAIGETDRVIAWKRMLEYFFSQSIITKLWGLGLAGERIYISRHIYGVGYPHNIFIEQLLQLGIVGLTITIFVVMSLMVKMFFGAYKSKEYATVIALFGAYFSILFFSSSYLSSNHFFVWISICICVIENGMYLKNKKDDISI